jgi:WD40 repeat protein
MAPFDPYHIWLGIPPEDQPPSHYRLLGIPELESNPDVIDGAAEQRTIYLRTFQAGDQASLAEKLLNEVSAARICLLNTESKATYDQQLLAATRPDPVPAPAAVHNDPPGVGGEQPTMPVWSPPVRELPQRRRISQTIWQQPRMLAVAGGLVAMILLVAVLNSGRDKPNPVRNPEERQAELKRLVDEGIKEGLLKAEEAAARAEMEKAAADKRAGEQAAAKAARDIVAAEEAAAKHEADKLAAEEAAAKREALRLATAEVAAKAAMAKAAAETLTLKRHSSSIYSVISGPDGKRIVSGSDDNTLKIWDAQTGQEILTLKGHSNSVNSVGFSPDGKRIVSGSRDSTLCVWDAEIGQEMLTLEGHLDWVNSVSFSPDGKRIVSGSRDSTLKVWDAETGQEMLTLKGHSRGVESVNFSPDGKRIVSGSRDSTLKVWDAETGQEMRTLEGHSGWVNSVSFNPDGKRVVSGSGDGTVNVWDTETAQLAFTLEGHSGWVNSVNFSPDGKRIVSGSGDGTVKVWDAETGQEMLTLEGHLDWVNSVSFSPDGKRIVSGSEDKTVKVWNVPSLEAATAVREMRVADKPDLIINSIGMKLIPAGEFQMGSPDSDSDAADREKPQHLVKITNPFYLGVYEVTQGQYEKVMGARPWQGKEYVKEGPDYPAVYVSHDDAVEFCRRLSKQEGVEYRLPTQAEWEYACRAGTTTTYSFGDGEAKLGQHAWYDKNAWDIGEKYAHRVGQKLPNRWGLYDMHGNVYEWCQDWHESYGSEKVVSDPLGDAQGIARELRGGSFRYRSSVVRSADRYCDLPDNRDSSLGFRAARTYHVSP